MGSRIGKLHSVKIEMFFPQFYKTQTNLSSKMFTKRLFSKSNKIHITCEKDNLCSICLDGFECSKHMFTTQCGHQFHTACFAEALKTKSVCPNCRTPVHQVTLNHSLLDRIRKFQKKCCKMLDYAFEHHFLVALVFSVPIGYTCIIGYIVYRVCKFVTYPIWKPLVSVYPTHNAIPY